MTKQSIRPCIHAIIMLAFMFFFGMIPPIGEITPLGMQVLGIFAGIIYGWSTLGMIVPSLLGIVGFGLLEGNNMVSTFTAAFGDRITVAMMLFLITAALVDKVGLSGYIANWCISRKFVAGRPWMIAIMFCVAGTIISATVNLFAAMILMWNIFYRFCEQVGFKKGDKYPALVLVGIIYCCTMGGGIFPFMGMSLLVVGQQITFTGVSIDFLSFTIIQLILTIMASSLYLLMAKFVFKPDVSQLLNNAEALEQYKGQRLTKDQKLVGILIVLLMVMLFLPGLLPKELALAGFLKSLDIAGVAAIIISAYYLLKLGQKDAIPFSELAKGISWELILMFATVAPLSKAVNNPDSGIMAFVSSHLSDLFVGMSPFVFMVVIFVIASIITQFANNVVVILIIAPIMYHFALQLGANPLVLTVIAAFSLNVAFLTPAASGPAAMVFSNQQWISTKYAYILGLIIFVINLLVTIVGIPIAEMLL